MVTCHPRVSIVCFSSYYFSTRYYSNREDPPGNKNPFVVRAIFLDAAGWVSALRTKKKSNIDSYRKWMKFRNSLEVTRPVETCRIVCRVVVSSTSDKRS